MARVVLVSHRVPVPGAPAVPSGLVSALQPGAEADGALWMGWSGRSLVSIAQRLSFTTQANIDYALLDLTAAERRRHYAGFCNQTLWPLLHGLADGVRFEPRNLLAYRRVNDLFAHQLAPLLRPDDRVWVHDYHLIPLGAALRALSVRNRLGFFLHTPVPAPVAWGALPAGAFLARSLHAYDLIGVQTAQDADRLRLLPGWGEMAAAARPGADRIGVFPASIATSAVAHLAATCRTCMGGAAMDTAWLRADGPMILGVDRLDPAKGVEARLAGFDAFLRGHPHRLGRVGLLQVIPDSRRDVPGYRALRLRLNARAAAINARHRQPGWIPVHTLARSLDASALAQLYRSARVALLTPLRDGMNLVAKEYVAAQDPVDPGVLVLSRHAGAAHELDGAILVAPEDTGQIARAIERALAMPLAERRRRWSGMYRHLQVHDARAWWRDFVGALGAAPRAPCALAAGRDLAQHRLP